MKSLYSVKRDEIYAGQVITDFNIETKRTEDKPKVGYSITYRSILFTINHLRLAEDLLYSSPNYPIFNISDIETIKNSPIIINNACNIGPLLKRLYYKSELDYMDVYGIRKRLFNGNYPNEHCELFGLQKLVPEQKIYYDEKGKVIHDPETLKEFIKKAKREELIGRYNFTEMNDVEDLDPRLIEKYFLPYEYFKLLHELGDNTLLEVMLGYEDKKDTFKPDKREGMIRSLKKYDL